MISNQKISEETVLAQAKGNIVSDMGGEKVMLSVNRGKYYNLGEIGGEIWDLMSKPISVKHLVDHLTLIFDVEHKECEEQVIEFVENLAKEGLIVVAN
ncbi:lasso peptide biosynthesis PqqD family chaperone [Fredinandcohnia humi]